MVVNEVVSGLNLGGLGAAITNLVQIAFVGLVILGMLGLIVWILMFNVKVEIIEPRGNGQMKISYDKAKKITKNGVVMYQLLKRRIMLQPPDSLKTFFSLGKFDHLKIYKVSEVEYRFCKFNRRDGYFEPLDQETLVWHLNMQERNVNKYDKRSWWAQHSAEVLVIMTLAVFIIAMILLFKNLENVVGMIGNMYQHACNAGTQVVTPNVPT